VYKGYDNGNDVFAVYGYFNNTVPSGWKTGVYSGSFNPTATTSGLELLNNGANEGTYAYASINGANEGTYAYASIPSLNGNYTVLVSWWYSGTADALVQELYGNASSLSAVDSVYSSTAGGDTPYASGGVADQNEFYNGVAYIRDSNGLGSASFVGQGTHYVVTEFAIVNGTTEYWGYTNVSSPFQLKMPTSLTEFSVKVARTSPYVFIGAGDYGDTSYVYLDTVLVFPTPPNNVMPSVTAIEPSRNTSGIAGQYIAWGYTPATT